MLTLTPPNDYSRLHSIASGADIWPNRQFLHSYKIRTAISSGRYARETKTYKSEKKANVIKLFFVIHRSPSMARKYCALCNLDS
jgi:hypothetical protein